MAAYSVPFWRSLCLIALCAISLQVHAARDDEADDEMDEVTPEELQMQEIPVDERIFVEKWNEVPYKKSYFTYTDAQIREKWDYLMRGLKVPYPSADYMRTQFKKSHSNFYRIQPPSRFGQFAKILGEKCQEKKWKCKCC